MGSFEDFVRDVEEKAQVEGDGAVFELELMRRHYRLIRQFAERRVQLKLTQGSLSDLSGIPQSEISRIERGKGNPTLLTLTRLSAALGMQMCLHDQAASCDLATSPRRSHRPSRAAR